MLVLTHTVSMYIMLSQMSISKETGMGMSGSLEAQNQQWGVHVKYIPTM